MGRAENRRQERQMKKKLTEEQFSMLKSKANEEMIMLETRKRFDKLMYIIDDVFIEIMRANRISEERAKKLNKEMWEGVVKKYGRL